MALFPARLVRPNIAFAAVAAMLTFAGCSSAVATQPALPAPPMTPGLSDPGSAPGRQPGNPGDPNGSVHSGPLQPGPVPGDGAAHVTPVAGVKDPRPAAIDRISVAADGRTITVYWYGGVDTCYALSSATAARDVNGRLLVTLMEGTRPGLPANTACIDLAQLKATTLMVDSQIFQDGSQPHDT